MGFRVSVLGLQIPVLDGIKAKIMMEALNLRGLQETDMIKPEDGKSAIGNRKPKTETPNPILDGI